MKDRTIKLNPDLGTVKRHFISFGRKLRKQILQTSEAEHHNLLKTYRSQLSQQLGKSLTSLELKLYLAESVLLDLLRQNWQIGKINQTIQLFFRKEYNPAEAKTRVKSWHSMERESQLAEPSVREFLRGMENRRLTHKGWHSIFSVICDGKLLAERLRNILDSRKSNILHSSIQNCIAPYIQFVEPDELCKETGLPLQDIWRYFRHTWTNAYRPLPGRSINILVRDASWPNHPVIGIASLGSSVVQQSLRDRWIGWDPTVFLQELRMHPSSRKARWLIRTLNEAIRSIYKNDLIRDNICSLYDIQKPNGSIISALLRESDRCIKRHRVNPQPSLHKPKQTMRNSDWRQMARTYLFRSKRCKLLANLLSIREAFNEIGFINGTQKDLILALKMPRVEHAIKQIVRLAKTQHVGVDMMDITVCGAIAPYNMLLGGKLICFLLMSPEITNYCFRRYRKQMSIIASSMSGHAVLRKPKLVLLCTTSLYGTGSSQYNRVKIPSTLFNSSNNVVPVSYEELGLSEGYGSFQFSPMTITLMKTLLGRQEGRKVNSIFGEGVNPKLRSIREALELIKLPSDDLLKHGSPRVVYGVPFATNFREILLGLDESPRYIIPSNNPQEKTDVLAEFWKSRWLSMRIKKDWVITEVEKHTLNYPIQHGARVILEDDEQLELGFH